MVLKEELERMDKVMRKPLFRYNSDKKPPLGVCPRFINGEIRLAEIRAAIIRYLISGLCVDEEWVKEYNEITLRQNLRKFKKKRS